MPYPDVVIFTLFRTDNPYSSVSLSLARALARDARIFYVNHPYTLKDAWKAYRQGDPVFKRRLPSLLRGKAVYEQEPTVPRNFIALQPPMTLPINWLPPGRVYDIFQRLNNAILLRAVRRMLRDYQVRDFVFYNCYDPFYLGVLPKSMGGRMNLYHCIDDITQNAYTDKHGTRLENEAVAEADVTLVTSSNLLKLKSVYSNRVQTFFNAADPAVFSRVRTETFPRPAELEGRKGPVIGFIGNLDDLRIDYKLIKAVAEAHADKTLLLIGPVNSNEPYELGIDRMPNVILAGSRPLHDLPPLLQHMDCVLIPFLCNTLTRSIYPLKINEYLAAGKPVVSTSFSDDIRGFGPYIYLAEDTAHFCRLIDDALLERDPDLEARRVDVAAANTWEARALQFWKLVGVSVKPEPQPTAV